MFAPKNVSLRMSLLFSLLLMASPACHHGDQASTEPSQKETIDFLVNSLNAQWNPQIISTVSYYDATVAVSIENCTINVTHRRNPGALTEKKFQWTAPLNVLDPEQIELRVMPGDPLSLGRERTLIIQTTNRNPEVTLNGSVKKDHLDIVIRPEGDDGQRLIKALRHLIILCGGKKSSF